MFVTTTPTSRAAGTSMCSNPTENVATIPIEPATCSSTSRLKRSVGQHITASCSRAAATSSSGE